MADIADKLYRVVDDLPGLEDGLELRGFVHIHQVLIQVKAGGCQQWPSVVVQVGVFG